MKDFLVDMDDRGFLLQGGENRQLLPLFPLRLRDMPGVPIMKWRLNRGGKAFIRN